MLADIRFEYYKLKYWFKEVLPFKICYYIPRKIALACFVRVFSTLGECPDSYVRAYNNWESGRGK